MYMNCGTDIIEISRIKESIETHGQTFLGKVFTDKEIEYCESKNAAKYQHYAVRFSAKEAVAKFFGTGFNGTFDWREIEVQNEDSGKPKIVLYGQAKELFNKQGYEKLVLSMSHCKEYATSMVIGY